MHDPSPTTVRPAPAGVDPWLVIDNLPDGVVILDPVGLVVWCNHAAASLLDRSVEELRGQAEAAVRSWCAQRGVEADRTPGGPHVLVLRSARVDEAARAVFLARAGDELAGSLNLDRTLGRAVSLAVPDLGDSCLLSFVENHELRRVGAARSDGGIDVWQEHGLAVEAAVDAAARVRATGASELHRDLSGDRLRTLVPPGPAWSALREPDPHSAVVVPLWGRGTPIGALVVLATSGRPPFDDEDLRLAEAFARRAAVALDNALLYRDRSVVAEMLQRSLLPPTLPAVPHVEIGARYRPLRQASDIGGDFYDVFQTGDDSWAVIVGDVCGKGIAAAAVTGLARHTARAAAMQVRAPSAILGALNDAVLHEDGQRFCTVGCARLVLRPGQADVTYASGGHPPAYLLRRDGEVVELRPAGMLLGTFPDVALEDVTVRMEVGEALVLYTDGVTEARVDGREFGADRLRQVVASSAGLHADTLAERIVQEVVDFVRDDQTDDIAVVVIRVEEPQRG